MAQKQPFSPAYGQGQTVTATTTSASYAIQGDAKTVCFTNTGTVTAYVRMAPDSQPATAADFPLLAGKSVTLTKSEIVSSFAILAASTTTTVHAIPGEGFLTGV